MLSLSILRGDSPVKTARGAHHLSEDECVEGIFQIVNDKLFWDSLVGGQVESAEARGASGASADSGASLRSE